MCSLEFAYKHGFITKLDYENTDVNAITDMFTGRVKTSKPLYGVIQKTS